MFTFFQRRTFFINDASVWILHNEITLGLITTLKEFVRVALKKLRRAVV